MRDARANIRLLAAIASAYLVCSVLSASTDGAVALTTRLLGGLLVLTMLVLAGRSAWLASQRKATNGGEAYRGWHRWALVPLILVWLAALVLLRTIEPDGSLFVVAVGAFAIVTSAALLLMVVTIERSYRTTSQAV
jgi:peptidoglycan/LPS O-acetylase OafA/YrhL